jgi:hypothetical protein
MISSKLVFRCLALEVGGRVGEVVRESWKNFDDAVGDAGGRGVETNSRGISGTGGCSSYGVFGREMVLGRRRLPLEARKLRVLAAETRLSRVPSIVRKLRILLRLRPLFVLFKLRMLAVSPISWLGGVMGGFSSSCAYANAGVRGDIADMRGIGDSGDIIGSGSTCMTVPPSGSIPGLGE